jgi:hypothetical protein
MKVNGKDYPIYYVKNVPKAKQISIISPCHPMPPTLSSNSIWFSLANFLSHRVLLPPTRPVPPTTSAQRPAARVATRGGVRCRRGVAEGAEGLRRAARQEPWLGAKCIFGGNSPGCDEILQKSKAHVKGEKSYVFAQS